MGFDYSTLSQATTLFNNFQKHEILTVNSLQQVRDFVMNKGDSYMMLDPNADILYLKEMDTIGKIQIRAFSLTEITDQILDNNTPAAISRSDYDKLLKRLEQLEAKNEVAKSEQPELNLD